MVTKQILIMRYPALIQALESGARWAVLCDTNGGTLPGDVYDIISALSARFPGDRLGIHAHNDTENAVSNSLAAIDAGFVRCKAL
jgi:2-isopropylmalate synthase